MTKLKRCVSVAMALVMLAVYAPLPSVMAAMIATDEVAGAESGDLQRAKIRAFLQRAEVTDMLEACGIDPSEAAGRVAGLTDSEVDQLARKIDRVPAGGGLIGTIAVIGVVFFLVLILLELTGFIDVFTFINSPRR